MAAKKQGTSWRFFSTEMVGIVFAVILALWLEGWYEDFQRRERADDFLERIRVEVSQNREDLNSAIMARRKTSTASPKFLQAVTCRWERSRPFSKLKAGPQPIQPGRPRK